MPPAQPKNFSVNLDLLRAVAVMLVFFGHFMSAAMHDRSFCSAGRFGVILFFIHTSFVLMASLQRLDVFAKRDASLMLTFWVRRLFRIYPLAILFVVLTAVFHIPSGPGKIYQWIGLTGFFSNLALVQNLNGSTNVLEVLWSLPLEVQMYVLLPFCYLAICGNRRYRSLALWTISVLLGLILPRINWRFGVFLYAPCFTSGIVAFDLIRSKQWKWKLQAWAWPVGIFAAIAIFGPHDNISLPNKIYSAWGLSLLLGGLYAYVNEGQSNWTYRVFHWIAEHSYGIYLSHSVLLWLVFNRMAQFPFWTQILFLVAGVIGIPALLYVYIEKPLIIAGGHVANRLLRLTKTGKELQLASI